MDVCLQQWDSSAIVTAALNNVELKVDRPGEDRPAGWVGFEEAQAFFIITFAVVGFNKWKHVLAAWATMCQQIYEWINDRVDKIEWKHVLAAWATMCQQIYEWINDRVGGKTRIGCVSNDMSTNIRVNQRSRCQSWNENTYWLREQRYVNKYTSESTIALTKLEWKHVLAAWATICAQTSFWGHFKN